MPFQRSQLNTVTWTLAGASSAIILYSFRHQLRESDEGHNVCSSIHAGVDAWIATVLKAEGMASFHIHNDTAGGYASDAGIRAQASGVITIQFGGLRTHTIPVFISSVEYTNETAAGTDFVVTFKLNQEVPRAIGASASYSYPS